MLCCILYSCNLDELGRRITELPDSSWTGSIAGVRACSVNWTRCIRRGSNHMTKLSDRKYLENRLQIVIYRLNSIHFSGFPGLEYRGMMAGLEWNL